MDNSASESFLKTFERTVRGDFAQRMGKVAETPQGPAKPRYLVIEIAPQDPAKH